MARFGLMGDTLGMGELQGGGSSPPQQGPEPCHECVGSQRSAPCTGKPDADDAKARAVQEMMERIKNGVVLRPTKDRVPLGQVGRDLGLAAARHLRPTGECPRVALGLGVGLRSAGSPGELWGQQDAATSPPSPPAGSGGSS